LYKEGKGIAQDYNKAADWCKKAAEQGLADAQLNLGLMYQNGEGCLLKLIQTSRLSLVHIAE